MALSSFCTHDDHCHGSVGSRWLWAAASASGGWHRAGGPSHESRTVTARRSRTVTVTVTVTYHESRLCRKQMTASLGSFCTGVARRSGDGPGPGPGAPPMILPG
jgi:hypothetical protein